MSDIEYREGRMDVVEMVDALEDGRNTLSIEQDDELESMTAVYDEFAYRVEADEDGFTGYNIVAMDLGTGSDIAARLGWELANLKNILRGDGRSEYELRPSEIDYSVEVQDLERTYPRADLTAHPEEVYHDPAATFHADGDAEDHIVFEDKELEDELGDLGLE